MFSILLVAMTMMPQESPTRHVRADAPEIAAIIRAGTSGSPTFRRLIAALDESDVIVYVEPKLTPSGLGGYLSHAVVVTGSHRFLRVFLETSGTRRHVVSVLAHELQHVIEVARAPEARDSASVTRLFATLAVVFGCDRENCFETQAARDVEALVLREMRR